jgi:hypothetical protein
MVSERIRWMVKKEQAEAGWREEHDHAAEWWYRAWDMVEGARVRFQGLAPRAGFLLSFQPYYWPVLWIHDILGWIQIRIWILGSMPLTNGSGSGFGSGSWIWILLFSSLTFKMPAKNLFFNTIFSAYYFLKLNLLHFSKIKSQKE